MFGRFVILVLGSAIITGSLEAQSRTAMKTGERTTGSTKQCYYESLGSEYTRTVESYQLCPLSIQVPSGTGDRTTPPREEPRREITAFKTGEETTGSTKQCYYDGLGKRYTKTVQSYQLCPVSIKVPQ